MLCQDCKKKDAKVHLTQIVNNEKVTLNLCKDCADKKGFSNPFEVQVFPLTQLLASMSTQLTEKKSGKEEKKCPVCGNGFSDFSRLGRFGCGSCYVTFRTQIADLLQKIHGTAVHKGKAPLAPTGDLLKGWQEEKKLQDELRKAIEKEDFEKAAQIRDQIKTMLSKK